LTSNEVIEIDLWRLLQAVARRWWVILITLCVFAALAFAGTHYLIVPKYSATVKLYVNNSTEQTTQTITSGDISASKSLVETYITIIRSDVVLDAVLAKTGVRYTTEELNKKITAGALNATEVFYVTVTTTNATVSSIIATAISDIAPGHLAEIVDGSSLKVVDRAKTPTEPSSPDIIMNTVIGALAGMLLSVMLIVLQTVLDVRISSEDDLQSLSQIPILGIISDFHSASKSGGYGDNYETPKAAKVVLV
jgi:capsular polysaccharide biosynthesis protein